MGPSGTGGPYHLILCRNLFIYLRPQARAVLAQSLAGALVPGGRLVIGTADRVEELNAVFLSLKPAASFAYTHRVPVALASTETDAPLTLEHNTRQQELIARHPTPNLEPNLAQAAIAPAPATHSTAAKHPVPSAESCYQSALQHHLHGDPRKAERRCRQALYIDPEYLPALELLATLWIKVPNPRLRRALADRILRNRLAAEIPASSSSSPTKTSEELTAPWKETA